MHFCANGLSGFDKIAAERKAEEVFLAILKRFNAASRNASEKRGTSYAPPLFADQPDAQGITAQQFKAAMGRLWQAGKIEIANNGSKSRPERTFVAVE